MGMNAERLRAMRATYQQKADAEQAAGNDKMETFYRGCHSAICVVLGEMWNEKTLEVAASSDDDELVDFDAFARDFMDASDSAIYNGEAVNRV